MNNPPNRNVSENVIERLEISGFRSMRHVVWQPGHLNLVVGPNGSGKSTLLQCLSLISKAAKGEFSKFISRSGGMVPLLWDHQPGDFGWKLRFKSPENNAPYATYDVIVGQVSRGSAYTFKNDSLVFWHEPDKPFGEGNNTGICRTEDGGVKQRAFVSGEIQDVAVKEVSINESVIGEVRKWGSVVAIQKWALYQDIEVGPESSLRRPTTTQYVTELDNVASNLAPVLHTLYTGNRDFKDAIDEGMRAGFGGEYDQLVFQPAAAQQIQLAVHWNSSREPHAGQDLSDGTLRFLFLLTALAQPDPPRVLALEEPEIGLHPSMLAIVADFAESISDRCQVIITSHSPDFLDTFSNKSPTISLCNWSDGQSSLYTLKPESLAAWLSQYRLGHLFTSGELEMLAMNDIESGNESAKPLSELPSEDDVTQNSVGNPESDS